MQNTKGVEQQDLSFIADEMQNGTTTLEISLTVSYKANHNPTI